MLKITQKVKYFIALSVILTTSAGLLLMSELMRVSNQDLLKHSILLSQSPCFSYGWVNDGTLWFWGTRTQPEHLDLKTGLSTKIPGFPNAFNKTSFYFTHVSPDGKWFLASSSSGGHWTAYSLYGRNKAGKTLPINVKNSIPLWFSDSKRWVEIYVDSKKFNWYLTNAIDREIKGGASRTEVKGYPFAMLSDEKILEASYHDDVIEIVQSELAVGKPIETLFEIAVPRLKGGSFAVSPKGDRIAWLSVQGVVSSMNWIGFSSTPFNLPDNASLWVSKIDGSDKRLIGVIQSADSRETSTLSWTPNGKSLSFLFKNHLYQVSAE